MFEYFYYILEYIKVNLLCYCKKCKNQKVDILFGICNYCEMEIF